MKQLFPVLLTCLLVTGAGSPQKDSFEECRKDFVAGVKTFHLPALQLSYVSNLQSIPDAAGIQKQIDFFQQINARLKAIPPPAPAGQQGTDYELMRYETKLNLERLSQEKKWADNRPDTVNTGGLYQLPNGKAWYAYFLKRWVGADVTPDEIYQFGLKEVERVKSHIETIRRESGMTESAFYNHLNDSSFFINDESLIKKSFEQTRQTVLKNLSHIFHVQQVPNVSIARGNNQALAQTPGYYTNDTFYFNLFAAPYNKRQIDWLFMHEAIPGHHYQTSIAAQANRSEVQQLYWYAGYAEGWGAYVEEYGKELGVYQTIYDELGKWEWDIVRSVRVPLDIGINYYGWTDQRALSFWKQHIRNQDGIAMREINRIKRWPAQVVCYKYGAGKIMGWKEKMQKEKGNSFDIRSFHDQVLNRGGLPFPVLEKKIFSAGTAH